MSLCPRVLQDAPQLFDKDDLLPLDSTQELIFPPELVVSCQMLCLSVMFSYLFAPAFVVCVIVIISSSSGSESLIIQRFYRCNHGTKVTFSPAAYGAVAEPSDSDLSWREDDLGVPHLAGRTDPAEEQTP